MKISFSDLNLFDIKRDTITTRLDLDTRVFNRRFNVRTRVIHCYV